MNSLNESEARAILAAAHFVEDASDWLVLEKPLGAFELQQGIVDVDGKNTGLLVWLHFFRSQDTNLITVKMSVFRQEKRQPKERVYQLHITTRSYDPQDWHDEAHEHVGTGRYPVKEWKDWRSFADVINFFCQRTNITFKPELDDPEQLRLTP